MRLGDGEPGDLDTPPFRYAEPLAGEHSQTDLGQSLRFTAISATDMNALRG